MNKTLQAEGPWGTYDAWAPRSACLGADPRWFYPEDETGKALNQLTPEGAALCAGCEVREECVAFRIANGDFFSANGGLTGRATRALVRRRWKYGMSLPAVQIPASAPQPVVEDAADSDPDWARAAFAYAGSHGVAKACEHFGVTHHVLYRRFDRHNLGRVGHATRRRRPVEQAKAEQAFAMAAASGAASASRHFGVSQSTLYKWFDQHDLGRPCRSGRRSA
jgi:WhiB family transcriptional regulator, redox-sensing transcriptional regulator